ENMGMLFRNLEFLGVSKLWITGYSPTPPDPKIVKIALGAEKSLEWEHVPKSTDVIQRLRADGFRIVALENTDDAIPIQEYDAPQRVALLLGREVEGISPTLLTECDDIILIPQRGKKESLNVAFAAVIASFQFLND
ncbi:MAG: TrmH family RNA methyltransferase, partial [bacterium]|nr:TrmH family RNA methyltransferase [bacterium]